MTVTFEGQDRRQAKLDKVMAEYGIKNLEPILLKIHSIKVELYQFS